jgi:hypothetical protein
MLTGKRIFEYLCSKTRLFDKQFKYHIENELKFDREFRLYKSTRFFNNNIKDFVKFIEEKYKHGCPSKLFEYVSEKLKIEHKVIHENISFLLLKNSS